MKKHDMPLTKDANGLNRKKDKVWCPEGGRYQYIDACEASCKKINKCMAYADYREPKLI
jgi:hypothetical protein